MANPNYNRFEIALAIQDAVNLRAIARELVKAADAACDEGGGTLASYVDPAVIPIVNKIESLVYSTEHFSQAYAACQAQAGGQR
jgi:hypothetical protein